jgi:hypothetical protein
MTGWHQKRQDAQVIADDVSLSGSLRLYGADGSLGFEMHFGHQF